MAADNRTDDGTHLRICTGPRPGRLLRQGGASSAQTRPVATLGFNENAVWGECKGSGSKPYQVEADLSGPVFKCTCPSRKFPCKHSLALLLLRVQQEAAFTQGEAPDWVKEWLDAREKRAARQEQKQENKGQPADPAGRSQARGVPPQTHGCRPGRSGALDVRPHTPRPRAAPPELRLAGGSRRAHGRRAASRHRRAVAEPARRHVLRGGLAGVVLAQFGQLQLLIDAFRHLDALSPEEQADVRAALGCPRIRTKCSPPGNA